MTSIIRPFSDNDENRWLIVAITPGRCGTQTLTAMLDSAPEISSVHEAEPTFCERSHMLKLHENEHVEKFKDKYDTLKSEHQQGEGYYADPSNMFAKSWGYSLLRYDPEFPDEIAIIYAHRNLHDLARSYFEWGYVPGINREWMPPLKSPHNTLNYPFELAGENDSAEARHVWYGFEMYFRALEIMDRFPDIPVFEYKLSDFGSGVAKSLYEWLQRPTPDQAITEENTKRHSTPQKYKDNPVKEIDSNESRRAYDLMSDVAEEYLGNFQSADELPFPSQETPS